MARLTERITNINTGNVLAYRVPYDVATLKVWKKLGEYEDAEERGLLLRLPSEYVYCLVDVNSKWGGMVMLKHIKNLTVFEIEDIDKRNYYSTREKAEAALAEMEGK